MKGVATIFGMSLETISKIVLAILLTIGLAYLVSGMLQVNPDVSYIT